jgi:hypothetical protein
MTTLREAAQQALEALEATHYDVGSAEKQRLQVMDAITALRAALAQEEPTARYKCTVVDDRHPNGMPFEQWVNAPQQEPVAVHQFRKQYCANWYDGHPDHTDGGGPYEERTLYAQPPRREWQSLSKEEIDDGRDQLPTEDLCGWSFRQGVYFAEKALKERNNG